MMTHVTRPRDWRDLPQGRGLSRPLLRLRRRAAELRHAVAHWLGWNEGRVHTWRTPGGKLMTGFRCGACGEVQGIHPVPTKRGGVS